MGNNMNLGERQAYEQGRKDGWQEAIVALASGAKKLLGPETTRALVQALEVGLAQQPAAPAGDDPTEPASWGPRPDFVAVGTAIASAHHELKHKVPPDVAKLGGVRVPSDLEVAESLRRAGGWADQGPMAENWHGRGGGEQP